MVSLSVKDLDLILQKNIGRIGIKILWFVKDLDERLQRNGENTISKHKRNKQTNKIFDSIIKMYSYIHRGMHKLQYTCIYIYIFTPK
jgi:hypothetical protein